MPRPIVPGADLVGGPEDGRHIYPEAERVIFFRNWWVSRKIYINVASSR